ncbi:MAG: peptidyl-prolyl cis-trans isomerase [Defluviitaleaceae bacterium]|nr:peptidyl-prolyl cis-trans isomerase [Defluviitaleaceae bacterium]
MKLLLTAIAVLLLFAACGNDNGDTNNGTAEFTTPQGTIAPTPTPQALDPADNEHIAHMVRNNVIVATINSIPITAGDVTFILWEAFNTLMPIYELMETEAWNRAVLEESVRLSAIPVLFRDYAQRHNIQLDPMEMATIEMEITEILEWHGEEEFVQMLAHDGIHGIEHLTYLLHMFSLMDTVMIEIVHNPGLFVQFEGYFDPPDDEELLGAKHILITFANFDSDEAALAFANDIHARAIAGEDFDTLVATYGEDPGMVASPEGYTFVSHVMVAEFEEGTRALTIGEISPPILTSHGYHIIKRTEPDPNNVTRPWGAPSPEQLRMQAVYMAFESMAENADIVFLPELYEIPVQ